MAQMTILRSGGTPLFGEPERREPPAYVLEGEHLAQELNQRLREKYRNYERAAARLELRGEHDAANLLRRAAGRVRLLRNATAACTAD
ncbi:MAG: hypothetical protein CMI63_14905 [Parvularcula sp.]|uniref:hypothetical protein n=1 Tax=Hyphococcus sp. TaxID=2038636 RepID=UPI000C369C7A|nr:hypothetical protein [Parvularcula sp.]